MATSVLSPLQLTVMDSLLNDPDTIGVSGNLTVAVGEYNANPAISTLLQAITLGSGGNILLPATLTALKSIGSTTCPALGDSTPAAYSGAVTSSASSPGFINAIESFGKLEAGDGDVSKYIQIFYAAQSFAVQNNDFILSAANANSYLGGTFTNTNDQITGYLTATSTDITLFAADLRRLGNLINLDNLDNWGLPSALIRQISRAAGGIPAITPILLANGVGIEFVANLDEPRATFTDAVEKQLYNAMKFVQGDALVQVLAVLGVTTPGITAMTDLLDLTKILPNSYQTLTVVVANANEPIFIPNTTSVNSVLAEQLPPYVVSSTV